MTARTFAADLELYGPQAPPPPKPLSLGRARRYCRRLARRHYENFSVLSRVLPRRLRGPVANIYAYCRWADDLADETGDPRRATALLRWWEGQLKECYAGRTTHPVFVALADTIRRFEIPQQPLVDLLVAFRQDQRVTRYETAGDVLGYCRYSANPVGRLVLHLGRCCTPERVHLSDAICTGLQLANFCQDVAADWDRGRVYLPMAECRRFGFIEPDFARRESTDAFRQLLGSQVDEAEGWLRRGWPLLGKLPPELRLPVALFVRGGLAILAAIRTADFDVWTARPTVAKMKKLHIVFECWWRDKRGTLVGSQP